MTFSNEWDNKYLNNTHISIWPWTDLISMISSDLRTNVKIKILEIGFGMGANIPFFLNSEADYYGIEGSLTAVNKVKKKFPQLNKKLIHGDFIFKKDYPVNFDIVVDRSSMTHNTTKSIKEGLLNIASAMKPGSRFYGIDWFSTDHTEFTRGFEIDLNTKVFEDESCFSGVGNVHFSDKGHLINIFDSSGFRIEKLNHKKTFTEIPDNKYIFATWNFIAIKC